MKNHEKWLWIELIGFDNEQADFGVKSFLEKLGFTPNGISLLLWNPDFIHSHTGLSDDGLLGETQCSYGARPYNEERQRQAWTKFQLRDLITRLRDQGIDVYLSIFDQIMSEEGYTIRDIPKRPQWIDENKEVLYVNKDGLTVPNTCPWKHLKDGSLYENFFIQQLSNVLTDYGFAGFHGADGYAHPRYPIHIGDFSDDMIAQFSDSENLVIPPETVSKRADWILANVKVQWIDFHTKRHQQFWAKTVQMLKTNNFKLIFNTCWTRDPFEARYRYGVDYKMLAEVGVDTFIVEAPAAVVELEGWNKTKTHTLDKFMSMTMRLKAYVPQCKLILLNCIKDNMEQYNALRHAPTMMESDVFSLANVFYRDSGLKRCLSGAMACLADGISQSEWHMISKTWETGFSGSPESISGATVIWSDKALDNESESYVSKQLCNSYQVHYKLLSNGAPVIETANVHDLDLLTGCLVVIHPFFFPDDDLKKVLAYHNGPVIFIGVEREDAFICNVFEEGEKVYSAATSLLPKANSEEPASWLDELPSQDPDRTFFEDCARKIREFSNSEILSDTTAKLKVNKLKMGTDTNLFIVRNEMPTYTTAEVDVKENIESASSLTDYPCLPISFQDSTFKFKLPPNGTAIIQIKNT